MKQNCASVSVVIPTYNAGDHLTAAINSVQAQTLSAAEIIVVDDGSTDQSAELAERLGAKVIRQANQGVSAARNVGIRAATSEWIAFIDQDDVWAPEKLEFQWEAIRRYPDVGIVSCDMNWFEPELGANPSRTNNDGGEASIRYFPRVDEELPLSRTTDNPSSVLIRRDQLLSAGLFDEELRQNEDLELFLRLSRRCSVAVVERSLVEHRVHAGSRSKDTLESGLSFIKVVEKLIAAPNKYTARAAEIYGPTLAACFYPLGRSLLAEGRGREARALFIRSLRNRYSNRALMLWTLSLVGPTLIITSSSG